MGEADIELQKGVALQESGDWAGALASYLRVVAADPGSAQGLFRAGLAQAHERQLAGAAALLERCVALQPGFAEASRALGAVLLAQARNPEAAVALARACALMPANAGVHYELGAAHQACGASAQAAAAFRRAVRLGPGHAAAHNQLGNVLRAEGKLQAAARAYERAAREDPGLVDAWYNLGATRQLQERFAQAIEAYLRALALSPANPSAENNLGLVLKAEGRIPESIAAFQRAIALRPDYAKAMVNLGAVLQDENRLEEAIAVLKKALALAPDDARAFGNLGNAYLAMNRPAAGIAAYEQALSIDPSFGGNRYNIALAQLVSGDLEQGWAGYDSRLETDAHRKTYPYDAPRWDGSASLQGRTLLVYAEQGLGDTLQFARYLPLLAARGGRVVVRVHTALKAFLSAQGFAAAIVGTREAVPDHDLQCSLLSLPRHFGTRLDSIPSAVPYLRANEAKVAQWRHVFAQAPGPKVGLVWAGNPKHQFDHNRSIPLELFSALTAGVQAHFFSLQKQVSAADAAALAQTPRITDFSRYVAQFSETAAIVSALDLVITVDTSVAHLAGALGTRAWVLLGYAPDWRWLLNRSDSPWYPSVRLFRQPALGDWGSVIEGVREALSALSPAPGG